MAFKRRQLKRKLVRREAWKAGADAATFMSSAIVARMEPTGPARSGRPDDGLREIRSRLRSWPISAAPVVRLRVRYWRSFRRACSLEARQSMTLSGHRT
jgi:hypothetical protein